MWWHGDLNPGSLMPEPEFQLSTHFFPWIPCNPASVLALFFLRDVFSTLPKLLIFRMRILPFSLLTWYFFFALSLWLSKVFLYVSFPGSFPVFCCVAHLHTGVTVPSGLKLHAHLFRLLAQQWSISLFGQPKPLPSPTGGCQRPHPCHPNSKTEEIKHKAHRKTDTTWERDRTETGRGEAENISQSKATRRAGQNPVKSSKTEINFQREKNGQDAIMAFIKREGARS